MEADGEEPTLLQTLRAHGGEVTCCDVTGDGARLASGGGDVALRLWRWGAGEGWAEAATAARAHRYGVTAVRWAGSGALLASGGVDGVVRVWAARDGLAARRELVLPAAAAVRALCWAGAGVLCSGHDDGALAMWHVATASPLARLRAHTGALHALAAPARGALLLSACTEGVFKVFDTYDVVYGCANGEPIPLVWEDGAHDLGALCADASECGHYAATGGHDARVRLWTAKGGRMEAEAVLLGHGAGVTAVRWAGVGHRARLLSGSLDRTARLWAPSGACLLVLQAHARYLTCVTLARDLSYMVTGSNDKSLRMWALGTLSLNDELAPPCSPFDHFGVGDLEGIGPVDDEELLRADAVGSEDSEVDGREGGSHCEWRESLGGGLNALAVSGEFLAAGSSDGRVYVWRREDGRLRLLHTLDGHEYPVMAVDFGADGALLLSAGLDGGARLWDVQTGVQLRALQPPAVHETETGGGGVRSCRVSPHRPPLLLLATDDGFAPLWSLSEPDPAPIHVYGGHAEAATCCAWSPCGRLLAVGGAAGELRLHCAPPTPCTLHHEADAHDLGVSSCDFAGHEAGRRAAAGERLLLASAGADELVKLWMLDYDEEAATLGVQLAAAVRAAGGVVASVRWARGGEEGGGALLVSAGGERWVRVWCVRADGGAATARCANAAPVAAAAGAAAALLLESGELAVGELGGEVVLWRLAADAADEDEDAGLEARWWGVSGVVRWLKDYVTRVPGAALDASAEAALLERVRDEQLRGAQLLDMPLRELMCRFGYGVGEDETNGVRARLLDELRWLRRVPLPPEKEAQLPHALRCPLSHRALWSPTRAADGVTYDRAALHDWFLAAEGAVSLSSGRRLLSARLEPNRAARLMARTHYAALTTPDDHDEEKEESEVPVMSNEVI